MRGNHAEYWKIETSSEPKTKLNMNMQMRLLKMFVKRNIRGDIVIEKVFGFYRTARNDSDDVRNFELVKNVKKSFFDFTYENSYKNAEY